MSTKFNITSFVSQNKTKTELMELARKHNVSLKPSMTKIMMKKKIIEALSQYICELKTVVLVLTECEHNGKIMYKGADGIYYDSEGTIQFR